MPSSLSAQQIGYNFLYSPANTLLGGQGTAVQTVSYSRRFSNHLTGLVSYSAFFLPVGGSRRGSSNFSAALQTDFNTVPGFLFPGKRGDISGVVFEDDRRKGTYTGMPLANVEVVLNGSRTAITDGKGAFLFRGVPEGDNVVQVAYRGARPFAFTTPGTVHTPVDKAIDFGISF